MCVWLAPERGGHAEQGQRYINCLIIQILSGELEDSPESGWMIDMPTARSSRLGHGGGSRTRDKEANDEIFMFIRNDKAWGGGAATRNEVGGETY